MYRVTPHSVTGVPPSELLHGQRLRCRLDNWYPDISQRVGNLQDKQKQTHDKASPQRSFSVGDLVFAENFTGTPPDGYLALWSWLLDHFLTKYS